MLRLGDSSYQGIIPRNGYGNFDLFAAHMLPQGAKHLPCMWSTSSLHTTLL